eukprot:TRINITY_DN24801_c1_g1_i1.p1 TRINITY_DN24801_c1_g1~~TRINITY_DN24801_c1_g1_i1.p1  ORF type:complete len:240 (+),score=50.30 TRINITY_DN24801_c1_g1_i1:69-788(+)
MSDPDTGKIEVALEEDDDSDAPDFGGAEEALPSAPPSPTARGEGPPGLLAMPASADSAMGSAPQVIVPGGMAQLAGRSSGPCVVLPPGQGGSAPLIPSEEEVLPPEDDGDGWLELLRDAQWTDFREVNEYPQPLPYHRVVSLHAHDGQRCPKGKYPRQALNRQLHVLQRFRVKEAFYMTGNSWVLPPRYGDGKERVQAYNQMKMMMGGKGKGGIVIGGGGKGYGGGKGRKGVQQTIGGK